MKGSIIITLFFAAGCLVGYGELMPFDHMAEQASKWLLCGLMFLVGVSLGHDENLLGQLRKLNPRVILLPVMTLAGTLGGSLATIFLLSDYSASDVLAVSSGLGYYSLSSIFISEFKGLELGTIALLCNVMREIFTLLFAPLVMRMFGPLAVISIGGATTADTTLPIITQTAGSRYAVVAVFHGCLLDFSVPFLVTLFCSL